MLKEELLKEISRVAADKSVSFREIEDAYTGGVSTDTDLLTHKRITVSDALYLVGALIVVTGISVLVGQHWSEIGIFIRILVTLGSAIVAFVCGWLLSRKAELTIWSAAFYIISSILLPLGVFVVFDSLGLLTENLFTESLIAFIVVFLHALAFWFLKKGVHLIFLIAYGVWFYYSVLVYLFGEQTISSDIVSYITMVLGVSLLFLGYAVSRSQFGRISGLIYSAGVVGLLGACMAVQGYGDDAKVYWEVLYPVISFGLIFLSSELKSKAVLVLSTLMLMGFILKITGEYFAENIGWSLALVIAGLLLMAIGYVAFEVNKRYLTRKNFIIQSTPSQN